MAARALLRGVLLPRRFAKTFLMPASSSTVRMDPPAITPVPGAAGRMRTLAAPSRPVDRVGIELWRVRRNFHQVLFGISDALAYGTDDIAGLADTNADLTALIADNNDGAKAHLFCRL